MGLLYKMSTFRKSPFVLFICSLCFLGCREEHKTLLDENVESYDSTALHLALMPTVDCLPIYYAKETGIFEELGLNVQLHSYTSQLDCDTALLQRVVQGGFTDAYRLEAYGDKASGLQAMWNGEASWQLFAGASLRIKSPQRLKGRTVVISRQSAENAGLEEALLSAGLDKEDVYKPQVNDLRLRTEMLLGKQIDAALLTWPYTEMAAAEGHRLLYTQPKGSQASCFVMDVAWLEANEANKKQFELLEKGKDMALDSLHMKGPVAYSGILQKKYGIVKAMADTLKLPNY